MPAPISDEHARAFAQALIRHGGNRRLAARDMGYPDSKNAKVRQMAMVRNPKVQKYLQAEIPNQLQSLTPKAVATLKALLTSKSAYIRLDAAKEVLTRNGIGTQRNGASTAPLIIDIQIGGRKIAPGTSESVATTINKYADIERTWDLD
jgi:hypothetical protein